MSIDYTLNARRRAKADPDDLFYKAQFGNDAYNRLGRINTELKRINTELDQSLTIRFSNTTLRLNEDGSYTRSEG